MLVGDVSILAIESAITRAVPNRSQLALGYFVLHVGGKVYGVRALDATMLGCSFQEVENRLRRRGTHVLPALADVDAALVADAYLGAMYRNTPRTGYCGLSRPAVIDAIHSSAVVWAPDGDEAFDDGSHVLQFDVGDRVRLVAFVNTQTRDQMVETIREVWLDAVSFYSILLNWSNEFRNMYSIASKLDPV
ncbi:Imm42 family immunity protein [Methylobrevis albus]|uniref:Uncharacterized protein n=1 Tax=Methylobrevis albus TaxID=2793297 RepID=A0A931I5R3_9HYPH|nr:Imm42 family immunity protein [Methylobrevis albus]MBH0239763.1 hypothetical protein [Methylobrevis albus]